MDKSIPEYPLEFLLSFDGRIHYLEEGYWIKFEIKRAKSSEERPHGLSYSFTLHAPSGKRLIGFDNAHSVAATGSRYKERSHIYDHWHRTESDSGRPYQFVNVETFLDDFFSEVERVLQEHGVGTTVIAGEEKDS